MSDCKKINILNDVYLSVSKMKGSYSSENESELAIMTNDPYWESTFGFRYDLTGGDVIGWFPDNKIEELVDWLRSNPSYILNEEKNTYNLPRMFLNEHGVTQ